MAKISILVNLTIAFFTKICYISIISYKGFSGPMYIVQGRGVYQSVELGCKGVVPRLGSRNTLSHIALPSGYRLPGFRMVSAARGWRYNRILPILLIPKKGLFGRLDEPFLMTKYLYEGRIYNGLL
jgi:hypothetical protein